MYRLLSAPVLMTFLVWLIAPPFAAQADTVDTYWDRYPALSIPLLETPPTIDGTVDLREWIGAVRLPAMIEHRSGVLDTDQTEVYMGYTADELLIAWRVHRSYDGPMVLAASQPGKVEGRGVWLDDAVEIFLDVGRQGERAIALAGNAAGAYGDGFYRSGVTDFAHSWNWRYAARVTESGWEGEVALPFSEVGLAGPPQPGDVWGLEFWRNNKTPDATLSTMAHSSRQFNRFAQIRFAGQSAVFRPLQTGSVGDESMGMMAEVQNPTETDQTITTYYGVYRLRDDASSVDFLDLIDMGLDEPDDTDDVIAFARPDRQVAQVLEFYEPIAQGKQEVVVTAGGRQPLNLVAHGVPVGSYVIAVRAVDEAGSVLWSSTMPAVRWDPVRVEVTPYLLHDLLAVDVSLHTSSLRQNVESIGLELLQDDQLVAENQVGKEALNAPIALACGDLQPGSYRVKVSVFDEQGQMISTASYDGYQPGHTPYWIEHDHGTKRFVPEPWTPVQASERVASVWGREVHFSDDDVLPAQIVSQGQPLWKSSPRLILTIAGRQQPWQGSVRLVEQDPEYVDYLWTGQAGDIPVQARMRLEFDGLLTIDLEMQTAEVQVDSFVVEFPFEPAAAQMYNFSTSRYGIPRESDVATSGAIQTSFSTGFKYAFWVGNPSAGLQWVANSNQYWRPRTGRAIEVVPEADQTLLRLRVIDQPMKTPQTMHYRWGLMASPVRPYDQPRNYNAELFYAQLSVPREFYIGDKEAEKRFERDVANAKELGANWINTFHWLNRYPAPYGPDTFSEPYLEDPAHIEAHRRAVEIIQNHGMRTTTYTGWNAMDPKMSDYPYYGEAMKRVPSRFTIGAYKPCMRGGFVEYQANGVAWLAENLGIEGVYLDGTAGPEPCNDPFHGCGYEDPGTGRRVVTYNLWEHRELFKRMYKILHGEVVNDGLIYSHSGGAPLLMVESFADIRHGAEGASLEHYLDLKGFMGRYDGRLYGLPFELTWVYQAPQDLVWGIGLLHDAPIKMYAAMFSQPRARATDYRRARGIGWRTWIGRRWFDWTTESQWHPYHDNEHVLSVDIQRAPASFHINDRKQVLFTAVNLVDEPRQATYTFDLGALNLPAHLYARDIVTDETFEIRDGRFTLDFLGFRPRLLMIAAEPVEQPQLNLEDL